MATLLSADSVETWVKLTPPSLLTQTSALLTPLSSARTMTMVSERGSYSQLMKVRLLSKPMVRPRKAQVAPSSSL